jgi:hypothetical protein
MKDENKSPAELLLRDFEEIFLVFSQENLMNTENTGELLSSQEM